MNEVDLMIPFIDELVRLPYVFNYLFWIVFVVMCINAFNLIDGIDGLAIGLGIIGSIMFFLLFQNIKELALMIFSISLCFGLIGILFYNISKKRKIFIGDTGSLMIGGMLVFFALKMISLYPNSTNEGSFFIVLGTIFIPLIDMIRVTLVRLVRGKSPFQAGREHIHHIVLDLMNGNHLRATMILLFCQLIIAVVFYWISSFGSITLVLILAAFFGLHIGMCAFLNQKRIKKY